MFYGTVIGSVWATQKHPSLTGQKLMIVRPSEFSGGAKGEYLVAVDTIGAGVGENVIYVTSSEAVIPMTVSQAPVDASIVGIVNRIDIEK